MHRRPQETTSAWRWSLLVLGAVLLLSTAPALESNASCNTYYPSRPDYWNGGGVAICLGVGGGCTECYDEDGNSCATDGSWCRPRQQYYF